MNFSIQKYSIMKSISILIALFCCFSTFGQTPIPTDTYMSFPLDGDATDVSGNNYTGTIVGGVSATSDRFGNASKAMLFNGTTGYIDIPYATSVGTLDFSVSYWANPASTNTGFVFTKEQSLVAPNQFRMGSTGAYFGCFSDNTNTYGGGLAFVPTTGVWSFYTIIRQGASIKLYVNGVYQSVLTTAGTINHSNALNYRIGSMYSGTTFFNGKIDDLRMFKHALSIGEIAALYAYGNPPVITSFTPVSGTIGTSVTITGTGFSATPADNIVYFGAVKATVSSSTSTSITVSVPAGAGSIVPVSVTESSGLAYSITCTTPRFTFTNTPNIVPKYWTSTSGTGSQPFSVAVSDFNMDGKADIVTANYNSNTVSVLLGNGIGSFAAATDFAVGTHPWSVAVGDFNEDGIPDIAAANYSSNTVSILLGTGTGSFGAATSFATGTMPMSIAVGDFNGDGKADLAIANNQSTNVSIFLGTGTGSFGAATNLALGVSPYSLVVGDFNGDHKADIATANYYANTVSIMLGTGTGTFAAAVNYSTGTGPNSIAVGDFNGDGKADLTTSNYTSNNVSVLLGNGNGTFGSATGFSVVDGPSSVAIGDFNGDGKADIVASHYGVLYESILLGNGAGSFATAANFTIGNYCRLIAVGDFNGDGKADMVATNSAISSVSVMMYTAPTVISSFSPVSGVAGNIVTITGTGFSATPANNIVYFGAVRATVTASTLTSITITVPAGAGSVVPVSVTIKGDVAYSNTCTTPFFTYTNTPNLNPYYQKTIYGSGQLYRMTVIGDFNGDGYSDMAAPSNSNIVSVFPGNGDGTFAVSNDFAVGTNPMCVAIGDFNGDGYPDLASANSGSNNISILLSTGTGSFSAAVNYGVATQPYSIAVGDFNNDGKADIATANFGSNNVSVLLGTGTGSFGTATNFSAGTNPWSLVVADFNNDGKADIAVSNRGSFNVSILIGNGTGGFATAVSYGVGLAPYTIATGDFNQDGKADLVTANNGPNTVSVLLNTGTGTFGTATDYVAGTNPTSVAIGDFNGDGKTDICTSNGFDDDVSILLGSGTGSFGADYSFSAGNNPTSIAVGDFNNDGRADMVATNSISSDIVVLLHNIGPIVSTQAVTDIDLLTATGNGTISYPGASNPTQHGVVWGISHLPTIALSTKTEQGPIDVTGPFISAITGLVPNTTYYIRAYATNSDGTSYGEELSFRTPYGNAWIGATSTDWNTASNWSEGTVPGNNTTVVINAGATNWPIYNGDFAIRSQCYDLNILSGAQLTVSGNFTFDEGNLVNNGILRIGGRWRRRTTYSVGTGTVEFYGETSSYIDPYPYNEQFLLNETFDTWPGSWQGDIGTGFGQFNRWLANWAGGTSPEAYFSGTSATGTRRMFRVFNTTGLSNITLQFKQYVYVSNSGYTGPYLKVQYSTNGTTWFDAGWSIHPTYNYMAPGVVFLTPDQGVGSATYYIAFTVTGDLSNIYKWAIDDVKLTYDFPVETFYNLINSKTVSPLLTQPGILNITNDLTLKPGSSFTNLTGSTINVVGAMTLESDATGTASYIDNGTTNVSGITTMQRYMNNTDWSDWKDGWHFLSSPVASQSISPNFTTNPASEYDFYSWYEAQNVWANYKNTTEVPTWLTANSNSLNFLPGKGYMAAYKTGGTKLFAGMLNKADVAITGLTINGTTATNRSWHLLGNPFPSALTWDANSNWNLTNIAGVSKIWNEVNQSYSDLPSSPASSIPATNGFMVQVVSGTGSLTLPASKRVHSSQAFYKSAEVGIKLIVRNIDQGNAQESAISLNPEATTGFDVMYDGDFLAGYGPLFYSLAGSEKLSTNSLPELPIETGIPFVFIPNEGNNFRFEASGFESVGATIWLLDKKTKTDHNLSTDPAYNFTASSKDVAERFLLHFSSLGVNEITGEAQPIVWYFDHQLFIVLQAEKSHLEVFDLQGKSILKSEIGGKGSHSVAFNYPSGFYVVKLTGNSVVKSTKIVNF